MADRSTLEVSHVPETSSRWITDSITGTFDFEVTNYPQLRGMAVSKSIISCHFRVGGHDWRLKFYPNGLNADSAYVQLASQGKKDASANFTLSVLGRDGEAPVVSYGGDMRVFSHDVEDEWGYLQFVTKSKLKSLSRHGGGCFTIRCVLTVRNESPPLELFDHLERMLQDGTGADITFVVDGREFRGHRCLLAARSPVFRAQFFGPMMEKDMPRVQVHDMDAAIFEMMLHYIYTGSMPPCRDDEGGGHQADAMEHLLVAADRYGLERLKTICEEELCKRMDVESVMSRYFMAKQRSCNRLKDACLSFMSSPEVLDVVLESVCIKDT
ncbi:BTB/POZ and MATH domain-containing protein 2-like [Lolium rigidum]|uniref:BTB/POZ and MATH domain-containing protein 2-like n=1 Tax=Lolium rigidum TaxID=89674 RepID=UPI001F5D7BE0|nr:BTB/POZ and MATH domain-containing protein 2-like [Lolium rigidum]